MAEGRSRYCDQVAEEFIRRLEDGTAPWVRPWAPGEAPPKPVNALSGKEYRSLNSLYLSMVQPDADPRWCTAKQAERLGAAVRKGEKGQTVRYFKFKDREPVRDGDGRPVLDGNGRREYREVELERPMFFHAVVFHASQIEGLPEYEAAPAKERGWEPVEAAQAILDESGAAIRHDQRDRAFYRPGTDEIHLPPQGQFPSPENYYSTALHELGHWTGHASRLDRQFGRFGDPEYAREELRAELASYMLGTELGVGHDGTNHAAYVASWIEVLKKDPREVYAATRDAERIGRFLKGRGREREKEQAVDETREKANGRGNAGAILADEVRDRLVELVAEKHGDQAAEAARSGVEAVFDLRARPVVNVAAAEVATAVDDAAKALEDFLGGAWAGRWPAEERGSLRARSALRTGGSTAVRDAVLASLGCATRRTDLAVPRAEKDEAKALGAKWDRKGRTWYAPQGTRLAPLARWMGGQEAAREVPGLARAKTRLAVPFAEKDEAKALGAKWDRAAGTWFAPEGTPLAPLARWMGRAAEERVGPAERADPVEEFGEFLKDKGLVLDGPPNMDGARHRVAVEGGRPGAVDGMYVGYLDGVPAGFAKNWKTGVEENWRSSTRALSREETAALRTEAAEKRAAREAKREEEYALAADAAADEFAGMAEMGPEGHAYLARKGLDSADGLGVKLDKGDLVVPLRDGEGTVWSLQRISGTGFKSFMKGGRVAGCFHVIGELDEAENRRGFDPREDPALAHAVPDAEKAPLEILVATGFGTGAVVHAATGQPVVCAISDHNLPAVAVAMRERFPDHDIVVLGDDDRHLEREGKANSGREKAERAAELADGLAVFPKFGLHERGREYTDWADVARANSRVDGAVESAAAGRNAVRRQIVIAAERERGRLRGRSRGGWNGAEVPDVVHDIARPKDAQTPERHPERGSQSRRGDFGRD